MVKNIFNFFKSRENRKTVASYLLVAVLLLEFLQIVVSYTFFGSKYAFITAKLQNISVLITLLSLITVIDEVSNTVKILWGLLLISFCVSFFINRGNIDFDYIINAIILLGVLTVLPIVKIQKKIIIVFCVLYLVYAGLIAFISNNMKVELGIINLNTNTSAFIMFCAEIILTALFLSGKKKTRIFCIVLFCVFFIAQIFFGGRSSLIGTLSIVLFLFFAKRINKMSKKTAKWLAFALTLGGILFALLYLGLYGILGDDFYVLGKDLFSGREIIWSDAFNQINEMHGWFFGIGYKFRSELLDGTTIGCASLHNQSMGYYTTFGGITLIFFALLFAKIVEKVTNGENKFITVILLVLTVMSYFDTIFYSNANVVHLSIVLVLVYCFSKDKEKKMVINYCWLGKNEKNEKIKYCINSWKEVCPDAEIVEWNEDNYDINKNVYINKAYKEGKYAFVADYMRFDILYKRGGVYMDTDVELLKDITPLTVSPFMGFEGVGKVNPGLIMNAIGGEELLKEVIDYYDAQVEFSTDKTVVDVTTEILEKYGLKKDGSKQTVNGFIIYPTEYFNPKGEDYGNEERTENTYSIHHYLASWKSILDQKIMKYRVKYGYKKGNVIFALRHPILAIKKLRSK